MDLRVKVGADLEAGPHLHDTSPTSLMKTARGKVPFFESKTSFSLMTALEVTGGNGAGFRQAAPRDRRVLPWGTNLLGKSSRNYNLKADFNPHILLKSPDPRSI